MYRLIRCLVRTVPGAAAVDKRRTAQRSVSAKIGRRSAWRGPPVCHGDYRELARHGQDLTIIIRNYHEQLSIAIVISNYPVRKKSLASGSPSGSPYRGHRMRGTSSGSTSIHGFEAHPMDSPLTAGCSSGP